MSIEKGMISTRQAALLIANQIISTTFLFIPASLARLAGHDAWLAVPLAAVVGLIFGMTGVALSLRFPGKNLVEYGIDILGPWLGRALGIIFGLFALYVAGIVVREFGELLATEVMPHTPMLVLNTLLVVLAAYGVYLGLEVFARVNEIVFPFTLIALFIIFALAVPEMDFFQLQPVMTHSFASLSKASSVLTSFLAEGAVSLMFISSLRKQGEAFRLVPAVVALFLITLVVVVTGVIALMGAKETARQIFPVYELAKTVHLGGFFERFESLVVGIWVSTVGLKLMVIFYAGILALAQSLNLRDYRPIVLPGGLILVALSILEFTDIIQVRSFLFSYWPPLSIVFFGGITALLWVVALLRKKGGAGMPAQAGGGRGSS